MNVFYFNLMNVLSVDVGELGPLWGKPAARCPAGVIIVGASAGRARTNATPSAPSLCWWGSRRGVMAPRTARHVTARSS